MGSAFVAWWDVLIVLPPRPAVNRGTLVTSTQLSRDVLLRGLVLWCCVCVLSCVQKVPPAPPPPPLPKRFINALPLLSSHVLLTMLCFVMSCVVVLLRERAVKTLLCCVVLCSDMLAPKLVIHQVRRCCWCLSITSKHSANESIWKVLESYVKLIYTRAKMNYCWGSV